jgi:hypothetical protein
MTSSNRLPARMAFAIVIVVYAALWVTTFEFVSREFGSNKAVGLSLVLAIPFVIALRLCLRRHAVRAVEIVYFLVLLCLTLAGSVVAVRQWQDVKPDPSDAKDVEFRQLADVVHSDRAFEHIEFRIAESKGYRYLLRGSAASHADVERLEVLCSQGGFSRGIMEIEVVVTNNGSGDQHKQRGAPSDALAEP